MLSSLLVLAEVTSQAPEATGPTKIMHDFGISLPGIAAQVLNVGIVVFILWKFAFKPVLATLDERQQKIASGLQYADQMKKSAWSRTAGERCQRQARPARGHPHR